MNKYLPFEFGIVASATATAIAALVALVVVACVVALVIVGLGYVGLGLDTDALHLVFLLFEQVGELLHTGGTHADAYASSLVDQLACILGSEFCHRRVELLGTRQIDIATLHVDIGEDTDGHVLTIVESDSKTLCHLLYCGLAEIAEHGSSHVFGDEGVLMRDFTRECLGVTGAQVFVGRDGRLSVQGLIAHVELSFVFYHNVTKFESY